MRIIRLSFLLCFFLFPSFFAFGQKQHETKNLVVILIDGYRWEELFNGADFDLLTNKKFNEVDSTRRMKEFWDDNLKKRRQKLMPFTWNYIAKHGQLYGDRKKGNKVNVKNPYWYSYPGRAEVFGGFVSQRIKSNKAMNNPDPDVLNFINKQKEYKGKVAAFTCWLQAGQNLNRENSDLLINVPWEDIKGNHLTDAEVLANETQHYFPKVFGSIERLDASVYALAKSYIQAKHPKVIYLDFGDTDEYAHAGKYFHYLLDIHNLDAMIENLWRMMQSDKFYKGKTTFLIVPDHGRGRGESWISHGSSVPHSDETWMMVMGPDTPGEGIMKGGKQIYQTQFAATMAQFLGLNYQPKGKTVGNAIESVMKY